MEQKDLKMSQSEPDGWDNNPLLKRIKNLESEVLDLKIQLNYVDEKLRSKLSYILKKVQNIEEKNLTL